MKTYKPDLNEKISIRISVALKDKLRSMCERQDLDEAVLARMALEAGIRIAERSGISDFMATREELLAERAEVPLKPDHERLRWTIQKAARGTRYELVAPGGSVSLSGPLYDVRAKAKKMVPDEDILLLIHPDGREERI